MTEMPNHRIAAFARNPSNTVRWWIYQRERFPLLAHGPLIAAFSFCAVSLSTTLRGESQLSMASVFVAFATCLLFFLQLRIADEFKDFEEDAKYRPYRPVPRGLVSLQELGRLFWVAALLQLVLAIWLDYRLTILLVIAWLYLAMMSREFWLRAYLESRPLVYLTSHMLIMPLVDLYATGTDWLPAGEGMPKALSWFLAASFFNGMSLDLGRKIRSPEDEEVGVRTYSVLWGRAISVGFWWSLLLVSMLCSLGVAIHLNAQKELAVGYLALLVACGAVGTRFVQQPKPGGGKRIETCTFAWTLAMYLGLGVTPLIMRSYQ